jgi:hypothetical protein
VRLLKRSRATPVYYIGGHPGGTRSAAGSLDVAASELVFVESKLLPGRKPSRLEIPLRAILGVEAKSKRELQQAPEGYLNLGIVLHGYGREARHPSGVGKLTDVLIVRYTDRHGDEQMVLFANHPLLGGGVRKLADAIISARYGARETGSQECRDNG